MRSTETDGLDACGRYGADAKGIDSGHVSPHSRHDWALIMSLAFSCAVTDALVKVNAHPYLLQLDLHGDVDEEHGAHTEREEVF